MDADQVLKKNILTLFEKWQANVKALIFWDYC